MILEDEMSDPASGWGLTDTEFSTIAYQDGALRIQIHADTGAAYSGFLVMANMPFCSLPRSSDRTMKEPSDFSARQPKASITARR